MSQIVHHWCIRIFRFVSQRTIIDSKQLLVEAAFAMNNYLYFLYFPDTAAAHIRCFIGTLGDVVVISFSGFLGTKIDKASPILAYILSRCFCILAAKLFCQL